MKSSQIRMFRKKLKADIENLLIRRRFHENYEWLEAYWQNKYKGKNYIDKFCKDFEDYYWKKDTVTQIAREIAFYPPIGSSKVDFEPTITIKRATFHLRYYTDLFDGEFPDINNEKEIGRNWKKCSFNALLTITKQIRDNLFHGRKTELSEPQYTRNKELITIAVKITDFVLDNLEQAEHKKTLHNNQYKQ